jgi:hypothetical protein
MRKADPAFVLNSQMSSGISKSLGKGVKAGRTWQSLAGYTAEQLMRHLERQFVEGMTWENRGADWHIDHIIPLSSFKFSCAEDREFKAAWCLSNLRPLWAQDNLEKRDRRLFLL